MRDDGYVWIGTIISTGVNCMTKNALIEMWENNSITDVNWP